MLDQGQTLTVATVARTYNLVTFDGMKTERGHRKTDGTYSAFRLDHNIDESKASERHLAQLNEQVLVSDTERGQVTVNITVASTGSVPKQTKRDILDAMLAKMPSIADRWLDNES